MFLVLEYLCQATPTEQSTSSDFCDSPKLSHDIPAGLQYQCHDNNDKARDELSVSKEITETDEGSFHRRNKLRSDGIVYT